MGTVQGNIRLTYKITSGAKLESSWVYRNRNSVDGKIIMKIMDLSRPCCIIELYHDCLISLDMIIIATL